jgi:mono/diheme cytochrome c family protein
MTIARIGTCALVALLALGACAKSSDQASTAASSNAMAAHPVPSVGAKVYQTNCSSCHQTSGQGVPGTFPPLVANEVVVGDSAKVIRIVKYGLTGPITVGGNAYNGIMPAWSQQLSNDDVAQAITFIRGAWGNKAGAVTEADVAGVKQ